MKKQLLIILVLANLLINAFVYAGCDGKLESGNEMNKTGRSADFLKWNVDVYKIKGKS